MSIGLNAPCWPILWRHDVSHTDMKRQAPDTRYHAPHIGLYRTFVLSVLLYTPQTRTSGRREVFWMLFRRNASDNCSEFVVRPDSDRCAGQVKVCCERKSREKACRSVIHAAVALDPCSSVSRWRQQTQNCEHYEFWEIIAILQGRNF